jgi:hypothetical protein
MKTYRVSLVREDRTQRCKDNSYALIWSSMIVTWEQAERLGMPLRTSHDALLLANKLLNADGRISPWTPEDDVELVEERLDA